MTLDSALQGTRGEGFGLMDLLLGVLPSDHYLDKLERRIVVFFAPQNIND